MIDKYLIILKFYSLWKNFILKDETLRFFRNILKILQEV